MPRVFKKSPCKQAAQFKFLPKISVLVHKKFSFFYDRRMERFFSSEYGEEESLFNFLVYAIFMEQNEEEKCLLYAHKKTYSFLSYSILLPMGR